METVDVLIVGAGSAGATLAWKCAASGLRTVLIDQRTRANAGACWVNGVERRLWADLGLPEPVHPVLHSAPHTFHMEATTGDRVTCRDVPVYDVDMGALTADLVARAEAEGADVRYETQLDALRFAGSRVAGATTTTRGRGRRKSATVDFEAALTVDASGMDGSLRRLLRRDEANTEPVPEADTCVAAQHVREITDRAAAEAFRAKSRLGANETLSWSSVRGGYSILNVQIDLDHGHVSLLAGSMLSRGQQGAIGLIDDAVRRMGFIGPKISGGGGLIPVRRAYDRLVGDGWALVGNAASQVFPAHGSGVAAGMRAAAILAAVARDAIDDGDTDTAALWPYAATYQRTRGAICASQEWVRRLADTFAPEDAGFLYAKGVIDPGAVTQSLACDAVTLSPRQLASTARAALRRPRLMARVSAAAARAQATKMLYERYPEVWDITAFAEWSRWRRRLWGE